jgi:two-component system chemotaxis sensor kinase CheA
VSEAGGAVTGLLTDRFLGQEEIFVKPLGLPLSRMKSLTGGTITGDGRIVFVMDTSTLV